MNHPFGRFRRRVRRVRRDRSRPDSQPLQRLSVRDSVGDATVDGIRLVLIAVVMAVLLCTLLARVWFLQIVQGDSHRARAAINQLRKTRLVPPRGDILDRNGVVLATNTARFAVYVIPAELPRIAGKSKQAPGRAEIHPVLQRLAALVGEDPAEMADSMARNGGGPSDPALVLAPVIQTAVARIAEHLDVLPGVVVQMEPVRRYPQGATAAHALGYTQPVNRSDLDDPDVRRRYRNTDYIGRSGVERSYDAMLSGTPGEMAYEVDRRETGRRLVASLDARPGATLTLTLDARLQKLAEQALGKRKGAVVVMDPRNGEVLVLASTPSYDPNLWSIRPLPSSVYRSLIQPNATNQALQAQLPPGSTMKIVTLAAGVESGKISSGTTVRCDGGLRLGKKARLGCTGFHRATSLYPAFASSCNAYFGQMGIWLGHGELERWSAAFGLGEPTGIDIPGEVDGNVDGPQTQEAIYRRYGREWTGWHNGDSANMAIGQGAMLVTPLQMVVAVATVANGGRRIKPHLVRSAVLPDGTAWKPKPEGGIPIGLGQGTLRTLEQAMAGVVESATGTAVSARVGGIEVVGKTGSAESRGKRSPTHAWFVCTAGRSGTDHELAISVWVDAGGKQLHGGSHAAPIARKLIAKFFGVVDKGALVADAARD